MGNLPSIAKLKNINFLQEKNFWIKQVNETLFSIRNLNTNSTEQYEVDHPFDEYQFALNISEGCITNNCGYPNVCLNQTTCACDNFYAYFFPEKNNFKNNRKNEFENLNNFNNNNLYNKINKIYCTYERKNQVRLSLFEVFLPGIGFFFAGFYAYGTIKLLVWALLYLIIVLKLGRCLKKDRLPEYVQSCVFAEYTRDLHF